MAEKQPEFDVILHNAPTSLDDWRRAEAAAASELPALNTDQKEVARKFGLSQEEYARSYLSLLYGQERTRSRARNLGEALQEILEEVGADYQLRAVVSDMDRQQWVFEIQAHQQIVDVAIPRELADDFLDSGLALYRNQIRNLILSSLQESAKQV